jgi:hypothetical protein
MWLFSDFKFQNNGNNMNSINRLLGGAALSLMLAACGAGLEDSSSSNTGSSSTASSSLTGTWKNSRGTSSWTFDGAGGGHYKMRSSDGGTCADITIAYSNVNLAAGTFTYHGVSEVWTGAYPAGPSATSQKIYNSTVTVSGNTAVIEGESYFKGSVAC